VNPLNSATLALPVDDSINPETVRTHLRAMNAWKKSWVRSGKAICSQDRKRIGSSSRCQTARSRWGLDGGYVRAAHLHPQRTSDRLVPHHHAADRLAAATKALQEQQAQTAADISNRLDSVKRLLWHGNVEEALERPGSSV
jgi:hypothetical protein